ncbi:MAG: hypothetical protein CSA62_06785 [Planctomycetota bacterium]|nr:MAG: hypothetical protein CSA62_06785 [Planctomycetota bacterium]
MLKRLLPVLALLVVGGLAWFLLAPRGDAGGGAEGIGASQPESLAGSSVSGESQEQPKAPPALAPEPVRLETSGEKTPDEDPPSYVRALSTLAGRVLWRHDRKAVAHTEIRCLELSLDLLSPDWGQMLEGVADIDLLRTRAQTKTDAEGRFELRGVHSRSMLLLLIGLGTEAQALRFVDDAPLPGQRKDLGDVLLMQRGGLRGQVLDHAGKPVADARVRVVDLPSIVMKFGVGRIDPKGLMAFCMGASGGIDQPITLIEIPAWVDRHWDELPFPWAITDAQGRFELRGARPGRSELLVQTLEHPVKMRTVRVRAGETRELSPTKLSKGATLAGVIVDGNGAPVVGAEITAGSLLPLMPEPSAIMPRPQLSDDEGRFKLSGLGRGKVLVAYRAPGQHNWRGKGPIRVTEDLTLTLPKLYGCELRVVDTSGHPIEGARLQVGKRTLPIPIPGFMKWLNAADHVEKVEDKPGVFRLKGLADADYVALASAEGFAASQQEFSPRAATPKLVTLTLSKSADFTIEVRGPRGQPVEAARVYWQQEKSRREGQGGSEMSELPIPLGRTDKDGRLRCKRVEQGARFFIAQHPAFAPGHSGKQLAQAGGSICIQLLPSGTIQGLVLENGQPPKESKMLVAGLSWRSSPQMREFMLPQFVATGPDGRFEIGGLLPGRYKVSVAPRMGGIASPMESFRFMRGIESSGGLPTREVELPLGGTARVRIELSPIAEAMGTGHVFGSVRMDRKVPEGVRVRLMGADSRSAGLDAKGQFDFAGLPDGKYHIELRQIDEANFTERRLGSQDAEIKNGGSVPVHFDIRTAVLEVQLSDLDGKPLPSVILNARGQALNSKDRRSMRSLALVDEKGLAVFEGLPEGRWWLEVEAGRKRVFLPVHSFELRAGQRLRKRLQVIKPVELAGSIRYELGELSEEERAFLGEPQVEWLSLRTARVRDGGWFSVDLDKSTQPHRFRAEELPLGKLRPYGGSEMGVDWGGPEFEVAGDDAGFTLVLRPDRGSVQRALKWSKKSKK